MERSPGITMTNRFIPGSRYYFRVGNDIKEMECIKIFRQSPAVLFNIRTAIALVEGKWVDHRTASYGAEYKEDVCVILSTSLFSDVEIAEGVVNNTRVELWSTRRCPASYEDGPWLPLGRREDQLLGVIDRKEYQLPEFIKLRKEK